MNKSTQVAIRLTRTPEVAKALALAKKRYPTLTDPEILKVGLAQLTNDLSEDNDLAEVRAMAAYSVGTDYLNDPAEDIYTLGMGKKIDAEEVNIKPFTVCLARFRFLESYQQKLRPVIVVGRPYGARHIFMAIPVSSSSVAEPIDISLENWIDIGLLKPSVARVHRLSAMLQNDLLEVIGTIDSKHQEAIRSALREMLKL